jgi:hypothetical protein
VALPLAVLAPAILSSGPALMGLGSSLGGLFGGGGGGGSTKDLEKAMQKQEEMYNRLIAEAEAERKAANRENMRRYNSLLGNERQLYMRTMQGLEGMGEQARADINSTYAKSGAALAQDNVSRGLSGTTVADTTQMGVNRERAGALARFNEALAQQKINADIGLTGNSQGIIERRTDQAPDMGQIAALASQLGAGAGAYGQLSQLPTGGGLAGVLENLAALGPLVGTIFGGSKAAKGEEKASGGGTANLLPGAGKLLNAGAPAGAKASTPAKIASVLPAASPMATAINLNGARSPNWLQLLQNGNFGNALGGLGILGNPVASSFLGLTGGTKLLGKLF